ncbi:MAG TPA: beta-galactosidase [Streptosporangiaceae bacterium]|nr:beta-galactosidase [Streptosporangiaceae bacterium]
MTEVPERRAAERMAAWRSRIGRIAYGGDYNPEQWPREVRREDLALMARAGVTMVSVGIFGWATVEPRPGEFDFSLFDEVMDGLAAHGIAACLATMTASPPPWLAELAPETLPVRADGVRLSPGARQHYCPSSPVYRHYAARLARQVATRYAGHPALAMWHVGNEYGCHVPACYCPVSAEDFRRWLRERYGDVAALNDAWSTAFWSQRYGSFAQVQPPRVAPTFGNPAQHLDFARFCSDALLECFLAERRVLDEITPDVPVTTNFIGVHPPVDEFRWAAHEDVVSNDSYPDPGDAGAYAGAAYTYDVMRSLRGGAPWLLMEQAPSAVNWRRRNLPKPPGLMRLWSWQAVAQGADAVMFFQWRASAGGAEKFHSAMVPHAGPGTRIFREVCELGAELAALPELLGTRAARADVALLLDWDSWWGLELGSHPSTLRQLDAQHAWYAPLLRAGVACDVAAPHADLSGYKLVVAPSLYMCGEDAAANLAGFVRAGGRLLVSFFSGVTDPCDRVHPGGCPGPLRPLLGLRVEEFWPLPDGGRIGVRFADGTRTDGTLWSEWIELEGATAEAVFADGELAGRPAITRHAAGSGAAWYAGTRLGADAAGRLLGRICAEAGVRPVLGGLPPGVQAAVRHGDGARYLFLLNHGPEPVTVALPEAGPDLLTDPGRPVDRAHLPVRGVAVIRLGG